MPILIPVDTVVEPPEPPPVISPDYGYGFVLVGGDGSRWDLCAGPVHILAGASGFGFPDPDHRWTDPLNTDGSVHQGLRYPRREFAVPLEVDGRFIPAEDWRDLEQRFWAALNPRTQPVLEVVSPTGDVRRLPFRYDGGGDEPIDLDPLRWRDNVYALEGVAGSPFWLGPTVVREYGQEADDGNTTFPGPPFYLGSSTAIESTTVVNPGDEESWWRVTVTGPYDTVTVGIGAAVTTLSTTVGAGETRVIETDPARGRSIRDGAGVLRWSEATALEFAAVPAGAEVPLTMSIAGGADGETAIALEFDTKYLRAFS